MFYEYALIPDVFDPTLLFCDGRADTIVTELLRGAAHNGMLASLHKGKWRTYISALVATIPSEDPETRRKSPRDKIQNCLELLDARNRVVRHPTCADGDPACNGDWLKAAMTSHAKVPFDGIIMCPALYDAAGLKTCPQAVPWDSALDAPFWTGRKPGVTVAKRKGAFMGALNPILRHAKAVTLIDPYIDPTINRWLPIVDIVQQLTGNRGTGSAAGWQARIHIHAGNPDPITPANRLNAWQAVLRKMPRQFRIKVFIWSKDISGPKLHDRYIITNQCGVTCPGGLDCYDDASKSSEADGTSTWSLMSHEDTSLHLAEYEENSSPYELLDSREFLPAGVP